MLLVQLPPQLSRDDDRLGYFLGRLPPWLPAAVEFRHSSWVHEDVFDLLARHRAAYCVMSGAGLPCVLRATGPVVYVRMHGPDPQHLYAGSYSDADLAWWADRIGEWTTTGKDVLVISTTTATAMRSATRTPCAPWSDDDGERGGVWTRWRGGVGGADAWVPGPGKPNASRSWFPVKRA